jgi:hypothetical protein
MNRQYSDYIAFVDESGSASHQHIDPLYPIFVLTFFVCKKDTYVFDLNPKINEFKFKHFGHAEVVLHERDIRKDLGSFTFLKSKSIKENFIFELTKIIKTVDAHVICVVIDKRKINQNNLNQDNLYSRALAIGLNALNLFIKTGSGCSNSNQALHIVIEKRGRKEDCLLLEQIQNFKLSEMPKDANFELVFSDKKSNAIGIQVADLIARPLGMSFLRPDQKNRAVEVVKKKLITGQNLDSSELSHRLLVFP